MATEHEYDEQIAPLLLAVARKCDELGMTLVAKAEWAPGEGGVTFTGVDRMGCEQQLTRYAAFARGNFDALARKLKKDFGHGGSWVLWQLGKRLQMDHNDFSV